MNEVHLAEVSKYLEVGKSRKRDVFITQRILHCDLFTSWSQNEEEIILIVCDSL